MVTVLSARVYEAYSMRMIGAASVGVILMDVVFYAQLAELFIQAGQMLSFCLFDVNQGGTNHHRCTQRLVIVLVTNPDRIKIGHHGLISWVFKL